MVVCRVEYSLEGAITLKQRKCGALTPALDNGHRSTQALHHPLMLTGSQRGVRIVIHAEDIPIAKDPHPTAPQVLLLLCKARVIDTFLEVLSRTYDLPGRSAVFGLRQYAVGVKSSENESRRFFRSFSVDLLRTSRRLRPGT